MSDPKLPPPPALPRSVLLVLNRAKAWFFALPRSARIMLTTTVVAGALIGGGVALQRVSEPYAPVFTQLDQEDASTILAKLKEMKVPYRVDANGTTIEVPESKARELRLELAGSGLPRGGGVGFESFDKMRLGATDFEQRVLYRRALEGELSRTIGTIAAIESSRVHLVMPEKSVFISRNEPATASIALKLRPGRSLGASEVEGMVHLVASAVPGLEADRITVVTTEGLTLHRPRKSGSGDDSDAMGNDEEARTAARSYETALEDRVRAMLERVVGPGKAEVRVMADLDSARVERVEERYDPAKSVLRSEEQTIERGGSEEPDDSVSGIPGAQSNLPKALGSASASAALPPAPASSVGSGRVRESHTRNYELDHITEKRTVAGGALKRLTVAVVLAGGKDDKGAALARPREELDKLAGLVRSAVGASDARGDVVTVESMAFMPLESEVLEPANPPPTRLEVARRWAPVALGSILVLAIAGAAIRRSRAVSASQTAAETIPAAKEEPQIEGRMKELLALGPGDLRAKAHTRAIEDPATAALVLRFWLGTSVPEAGEPAKT